MADWQRLEGRKLEGGAIAKSEGQIPKVDAKTVEQSLSDLSDFTPGMQTVFLLHAHGFSARTSAPMPLSGQEQAAWAGVLSTRRGGKTLPNAVQTALVAFFSDPPCVWPTS